MGRLIHPDGCTTDVFPKHGKEFTLQELHEYVGGYIELVRTISGKVMFVNEDGKRLELPVNRKATELARVAPGDWIVGNAIICEKGEVS